MSLCHLLTIPPDKTLLRRVSTHRCLQLAEFCGRYDILLFWTRSSPQPLDLCLLSPEISAYAAMRGAPDRHLRSTVSHFISDYQLLDQHLSTTLSAPVSRLITKLPKCTWMQKASLENLFSRNLPLLYLPLLKYLRGEEP